jgi:signal transduction histidine kinase
MASLGMLVAGIAHEINTPIGSVSSMHDTLMKAMSKLGDILQQETAEQRLNNKEIQPLLEMIHDANRVICSGTERVTTIVRRLRSFARLDEAELKEVDLHEGIEDTLTLVHHEIKHHIKVHREFGHIPKISCFPGRLNQVFVNMLINAKQAIPDKGEIWITTSSDEGNVSIRFRDNGVGIAPERIEKIFDPGFTTKGVGVGTGLGLSICYQIIQDHHGEILVESEVGKGSTFTILLPINLQKILNHG